MSELGYRQKCLSQKANACDVCGANRRLVVHHINGDRSDNRLENLVPLCHSCHGSVHLAAGPRGEIAHLQKQLPEASKCWETNQTESGRGPIDESNFVNPDPDFTDAKRAVLSVLKRHEEMELNEIDQEVDYTYNTVWNSLRGLRIAGWIEKRERGLYHLVYDGECYVEQTIHCKDEDVRGRR